MPDGLAPLLLATNPRLRRRHRCRRHAASSNGFQSGGPRVVQDVSADVPHSCLHGGGDVSDTQVTNETAAATNIDKPSYSSGVDIREVHLPMVSAEGCVTVHAEWLP